MEIERKFNILLELTKDEAVVLFDFLCRLNEQEDKSLSIDEAEEKLLWNLESLLEKELEEPFDSDYLNILSKAKERINNGNSR